MNYKMWETFYFLFPMVSSSKLRRASSRPLLVPTARVKDDDFDSNPGWTRWVVEIRPLPEPSRFNRLSPGSPEELGRLLDIIALFEVLPVREIRPLSESACWKKYKKKFQWCFTASAFQGINFQWRSKRWCRIQLSVHLTRLGHFCH